MFMFDVAYGLGCDSKDQLILIRLHKMIDAAIYAANPSSFFVVSPKSPLFASCCI
jgi:hypothetical protein